MRGRSDERGSWISVLAARHDDDDDDDVFILYSLILCSCLLIVSLLYILFPENISLFPLISWFVLYLILRAFTKQDATISRTRPRFWARKSDLLESFRSLSFSV